MKRLAIISGCVLLSSCTHYAPKPLGLQTYPATYDSRGLEPVATDQVWTEANFVARALEISPAILLSESSARTALAAARSAKLHPAAGLSLTAEYSKAAGGSSPWLYGVALDLPLDLAQRRDSRVQSADLAALQALYAYGEAVWTGYVTINHAVIDRRAADKALAAASDLVAARKTLLTLTKQRRDLGEEQSEAVARAMTDLAAAESRVRAESARRSQTDQVLAQALGVTADKVADLQIATEPDDMPIDRVQLMSWRRDAVLMRKDVLSAVAAYERADLDLRLAYAKQYPEIRLGPGYVWERGVDKLPLAVGLSLPPYDLNHAAIVEANARRIEGGRLLENSQAAVLAAVDQAQAALEQARANRTQAEQIDLPLARKSFETAQRTTLLGETNGLELAATKAAVAEATLSALEARHLASLAQANLEDALRRPLNPQDIQVLQSATDRLKVKP